MCVHWVGCSRSCEINVKFLGHSSMQYGCSLLCRWQELLIMRVVISTFRDESYRQPQRRGSVKFNWPDCPDLICFQWYWSECQLIILSCDEPVSCVLWFFNYSLSNMTGIKCSIYVIFIQVYHILISIRNVVNVSMWTVMSLFMHSWQNSVTTNLSVSKRYISFMLLFYDASM